jgi:hypothetical protein
MSEKRGTRWWPRVPRRRVSRGHIPDSMLVLYVDGELSPRQSAAVSSHLDACWSCRARRDELDETISGFVGYWRRTLGAEERPKSAALLRFRAALRNRFESSLVEPKEHSRLEWIRSGLSLLSAPQLRRALAPVVVGVVAVAGTITVIWLGSARASVSGAEVIRRADTRLADLVKPGQVLYRRWHTSTIVRSAGREMTRSEGIAEEWAEGSLPNRLARRSHAADGRLTSASWTVAENGTLRGFQFRNPTTYPWPRDASRLVVPSVFVTPTNNELQREVRRFPEPERRALQLLLAVDPIAGDRAWYSLATTVGGLVGHEMKAEPTRLADGRAGLRLSLVVPTGMLWEYRRDGVAFVPTVWHAAYVFAADSGLLQETEREWAMGDGCAISVRYEVEVLRVEPAATCADKFTFSPPPGTPTVHIHAADLVKSMRQTLLRPGGTKRK